MTGTAPAGLGEGRGPACPLPPAGSPGPVLAAPRGRPGPSAPAGSPARAGSFPPRLEPSRARTRDRDSYVTRYVTLCGVTLGYTYRVGRCSPEQLRALSRGAGVGKPRFKPWHAPCNYPLRQRKRSGRKKGSPGGEGNFPAGRKLRQLTREPARSRGPAPKRRGRTELAETLWPRVTNLSNSGATAKLGSGNTGAAPTQTTLLAHGLA